jgi:hypothetical protein
MKPTTGVRKIPSTIQIGMSVVVIPTAYHGAISPDATMKAIKGGFTRTF